MGGSEHAEAAALSGPATPDAYAAIADAFDELAAAGPRRPSKGYHELITALHQSIVQPGCVRARDRQRLAATCSPRSRRREGVGVDVSPGMVELARARHPELRFEPAAGEDVELDGTFDYVVLSDLVPYVDDLLGPVRQTSRRASRRRDPDRHPLVQPALAAGAAGARAGCG